jgi:hypothetical protein
MILLMAGVFGFVIDPLNSSMLTSSSGRWCNHISFDTACPLFVTIFAENAKIPPKRLVGVFVYPGFR